MASNEKIQGVTSGIIVKSIGAAIALDLPKHKKTCIIVAYLLTDNANDVQFLALHLPKKSLTRAEVIAAISKAEKSKAVFYVDFDGKDKDIYVCRAKEGDVYDFVERESVSNKYVDGFAEIEEGVLRFTTDAADFKLDEKLGAKVQYYPEPFLYAPNSLQYAVVNAYNACLLGKLFSHEEFQLETGDGERAKIEVRTIRAKYVDLSTIYVKPDVLEGEKVVNSYTAEQINVINGDDMMQRTYKITYRRSLNDYMIARSE